MSATEDRKKEYLPFLTEEHVIRAHECGADRKLKFHILMDYLQDIAASHAELLDVGLSALTEKGTFWVLSRLKLSVSRYPACDEKIFLKTYPSGINSLFATREYVMTDEKGEILVKGTSFWLVIDGKTFRPMKAASFLPENMPLNPSLPRFFQDLGKMEKHNTHKNLSFTVRHGDIDMNQHLNNALFGKNILESICHSVNDHAAIKTVQINFVSSASLGENLCFGTRITKEEHTVNFYADACSPDGKKYYIQAEGTLFD